MIKKCFIAILILASFKSNAQPKLGITAGYNLANLAQYGEPAYNTNTIKNNYINSFNAGLISEMKLDSQLYLQPSLLFSGGGTHKVATDDVANTYNYSNTTIKLYYIKLPVNCIYKFKFISSSKVLTGAGLYAAEGITGSEKGYAQESADPSFVDNIDNTVKFTSKTQSPEENTIFVKNVDFGWNLTAGFDWKKLQLSANYSHSFTHVYTDAGFNYKNSVFSFSVAYFFDNKHKVD